MRKHIGKRELLETCVREWRRTFVPDDQASRAYADKLERIDIAFNGKDRPSLADEDPVSGYARICRILSEKEGS